MMQLILETEPSGDIKDMSMEVDTTVNGGIAGLKNEINQVNKENALLQNDNNSDKCLAASDTELNLSAEFKRAENSLDNDTVEKTISEVIPENNANDITNYGVHEKVELEMEKMFNSSNSNIEEMDVDMETDLKISENLDESSEKDKQILNTKIEEDPAETDKLKETEKMDDSVKANHSIEQHMNSDLNLQIGENLNNVTKLDDVTLAATNNEDNVESDFILEGMKSNVADEAKDVIQIENETLINDISMKSNILEDAEISHATVADDKIIQEETEAANNVMETNILENGTTEEVEENTTSSLEPLEDAKKSSSTTKIYLTTVSEDKVIQDETETANGVIETNILENSSTEEVKENNFVSLEPLKDAEKSRVTETSAPEAKDEIINEESEIVNISAMETDKLAYGATTEIKEIYIGSSEPVEDSKQSVVTDENKESLVQENTESADNDLGKDSNLSYDTENCCASKDKIRRDITDKVTLTSSDEAYIDENNVIPTVTDNSSSTVNSVPDAKMDILNENCKDIDQSPVNDEVKEEIDCAAEDISETSKDKPPEHITSDDQESLETENLQTKSIKISEKNHDTTVKTLSEKVLPETQEDSHNTLNNSVDSIKKEVDAIDVKNVQEKEQVTAVVTSVKPEISSVLTENMSMDIDTPEVAGTSNENLSVNNSIADHISFDNVKNKTSNAMEVSEILTENILKDKPVSEYVDLDKDEISETHALNPAICDDKGKLEVNSENVEVIDDEDIRIIEDDDTSKTKEEKGAEAEQSKTLPVVCKLSNTLDILSDDDEEEPKVEESKTDDVATEKQCIDIDDDDDIMFIEDDSNSNSKETATEFNEKKSTDNTDAPKSPNIKTDLETGEKEVIPIDITESPIITEKVPDEPPTEEKPTEKEPQEPEEKNEIPLLPKKFLKTAKKNLGEMTRDELEDFCIVKIVESLVDRSGLNEIKNQMKVLSRTMEEYRKKATLLAKQNRDFQVVVKSVQEEQKKRTNVIQPLKITRSVGMQVLMTDKPNLRRPGPIPNQCTVNSRPLRSTTQQNKNANKAGAIPVPRLVPANVAPSKSPISSLAKVPTPNGIKNPSPTIVPKAEKRTQSRIQSTSSVTVDLTDDEPPTKIKAKASPVPPVRLVSPQNLMQHKVPPYQNNSNNNSTPRKVYIPISGPQTQGIRPGQAVMLKSVATGPRPRMPQIPRTPMSSFKVQEKLRHPAPLPDAVKQYTPVTWKPLPPAPDLKLSKVENGIVISWKIDGIPESSYETVASYQLYAYQETACPPSTALWKKIGDVKALPLPMACTLTQFMAGFKYYFAVRAVDIRSRLGPFSVPGSILLLSKA